MTARATPRTDEFAKIGTKERLSFGAGDLATNIAWGAMSTYIVFFYTDIIGAAAAAIGTIMLVSRILDGVSDVAMGAVVDRTNSKHGRARPWILRLAVPFAIGLILIFTVPDVSPGWTLVYIAVTYNILVLLFTGVVIPYGTLNTRMTRDFQERSRLNVTRMFAATAGILLVTVLTIPLVDSLGGEQPGWITAFVIFALIGTALFLVTFKNTKERIIDPPASVSQPGFKDSVKAAVKNKYWVLLFGIFIVFSAAESMYTGASAYYAENLLGNTSFVALVSFLLYIPALIGMLFMGPIYRRFGKIAPMIVGAVIFVIGSVVMAIDPENLTFAIAGTLIRGIGRIPIFGAIWGMLPDTIEYGEWKTGKRVEGILYSAGSMGQKAGYGFGAALLGWIMGAAGYDGLQDVQPDSAITAISAVFIHIPAVLFIVLIVLFAFYKLERIYPTVEKDLQERHRTSS
ncbi:MFS transporter [Ruania zhangjianzhongii]|uniref:MFS transporter n=1 Tax=Ruania zhangjianzhongii TaxID=2603206 RepID=UPI0011C95858|nr:MFS transporter [Ruania zhangjianzhongii]